jgi:hypothetical protein
MGVGDIALEFLEAYNSFLGSLPTPVQSFINLFLLVLVVIVYSVIVWKFYKVMAEKNIFGLNLSQYNKSEHPFFTKMMAALFYLLEYIIIIPFMIFLWFGIFTLLLILLTAEGIPVSTILLVSAVVIAAIRMTAYYRRALSEDIAKILPFTFLAVFVLNPTFFTSDFITRIFGRFSEIPSFISEILTYLIFIIILEVVLRFFEFLFSLFNIGTEEQPKKEEEN